MQQELEALEGALEKPQHPVAAVVGGAKISTKLDVLGHLIEKVDQLIIGGAMANTFLAAQGVNVGKSLCEHEMLDSARDIMAKASGSGCEIVLPSDAVVAAEFKEGAASEAVGVDAVPSDKMILDVGPKSTGGWPATRPWCGTARSAPSRSSRSTSAPPRWPAKPPGSPARASC